MWVAKCIDIKIIDAHELVVLLWVHHIISVHCEKTANDGTSKVKMNIHRSFDKNNPTGSSIRMNYRGDACWLHIPYV